MRKMIIFGTGGSATRLYNSLKGTGEFLFAVDNNPKKHGTEFGDGLMVYPPKKLLECDFDMVYIGALGFSEQIKNQLVEELHIPPHKIDAYSCEIYEKAKWLFTYRFAELAKERGIGGSVAEAGVFQGNFSKEINKAFPDRNLYLFDTFESFDERDLLIEQAHGFSNRKSDFFNNTSVETVLSKLPHRSKAIVKQGYFPDTFDLKDERFCFVNLDMDLYKPTKDGLRLFWPLMERGGVILVHDYFSDDFKGAKQAFDEFCAENDLFGFPIGDDFTMALIKQ